MGHPVRLEYLLGPFTYVHRMQTKRTSGSIDVHRDEVVVTTLKTAEYVSALRRSVFKTLYGGNIIPLLRGTQSAPVEVLANAPIMYSNTVVLPLFPDPRIGTSATWLAIDEQSISRRCQQQSQRLPREEHC